ncbi:MgtC/SapB family protein [Alcanivorax sp. 1008]|uniref:MgtC/SapB family protein n=1 Tax=Alcanivorax sp. 1008 TaxID=2816853 RepID=UPI001D56B1B7|nr:MgtC/SapB family protein [Alcanivorax sp. 1008]MCC1495358.1 MgtC/SapB family protein [Alcanivorax sp. 1008]
MDELANQFISTNQTALRLISALLIGMLIGVERGWEAREKQSGQRIAGIRTHSLVGLLGGLGVLLSNLIGSWVWPALLLALTAVSLSAYRMHSQRTGDLSITGLVSLLLTFCFGAMAMAGELVLAAAAAVVTVIILDNKREIHGLLSKLQAHELDAGFKLLLISVVVLPLLPNEGMGPYQAINPFEIWWMVVLIASISFVGYFAMRGWGASKGILFTSLFAGLSSSTALTLQFARQSRDAPALSPLLASGILLACGTMFPRILVYCALLSPALFNSLIVPMLVMTLALYLPALAIWRRHRVQSVDSPEMKQNPLDLSAAVLFGLLLGGVMLLASWMQEVMGDQGLYLLAAASGIADVDAITLSLTRMTTSGLDLSTATLAIVVAAAVNSLVKSFIAVAIGTRALALRVAVPMMLSLGGGLVAALVL